MPGLLNERKPLELTATGGAIALALRRIDGLAVRVVRPDGQLITSQVFHRDARLLRWGDDGFLIVAVGAFNTLVASVRTASLARTSDLSLPVTGMERVTAAAIVGDAPLALTTERFLNFVTKTAVPWSTVLGEEPAKVFQKSRLYGVAAGPDRLLVAWGSDQTLAVAALDPAGTLLGLKVDDKFFGFQGQYGASVVPHPAGMWLFDGNPVRMTQIGFDLARTDLGQQDELRTFYRTVPVVAGLPWKGSAIGFWLTVFPGLDRSQAEYVHQVYGCQFQPGAARCDRKFLVAETGLGGYGIATEPMAATVLADGQGFAVAHSDAQGRTWLRIGDLGCALR